MSEGKQLKQCVAGLEGMCTIVGRAGIQGCLRTNSLIDHLLVERQDQKIRKETRNLERIGGLMTEEEKENGIQSKKRKTVCLGLMIDLLIRLVSF